MMCMQQQVVRATAMIGTGSCNITVAQVHIFIVASADLAQLGQASLLLRVVDWLATWKPLQSREASYAKLLTQ